MLNYLKLFPLIFLLTLLVACGGGGIDATTDTAFPAETYTNVEVNGKLLMGGALQVKGAVFSPSGTVFTIAGTAGTTGTVTGFNSPTGITTDGTYLYVADCENHVIRRIDANGKVEVFAGKPGVIGSTNGDGTTEATFYRPTDITTDGTNLYVTDSYNYTIRKIVIATRDVSPLAGTAGRSGAVDAVGPAARFTYLNGITTDGTNLYVTDAYNTIRKIVISSGKVYTVAGKAGSAGSADGIGGAARFYLPAHITTDGTYLYVTDFHNRTIRRVSIASGEVKTIIGNASVAPGKTDVTGAGTAAIFRQLDGITTDGTSLYVTDSYDNTIYKIGKNDPWLVTKLSGVTGTAGHADTADGTPLFDTPRGLTTDGTGLYVTDSRNNVIRKIQ